MGDKWIESTLHQSSVAPLIVGIGMILFSFLPLYVDNIAKLNRDSKDIGLKDTLIVGVAQALALIPGTSRSGITMTAGLWRGLKREDAARFSFLLAAPISLGAGLYKAFGLIANPEPKVSMLQVGVGIVASGLVGLAVIKWLLRYLGSHNLRLFVVYRIAFGVLVIALWVWRQ
jgi:undecaprenyl-diphosphatase